jgi:hypothetical protein
MIPRAGELLGAARLLRPDPSRGPHSRVELNSSVADRAASNPDRISIRFLRARPRLVRTALAFVAVAALLGVLYWLIGEAKRCILPESRSRFWRSKSGSSEADSSRLSICRRRYRLNDIAVQRAPTAAIAT